MAPPPASETKKKKKKKNKAGSSNDEANVKDMADLKSMLAFPRLPPAVEAATLPWHEYVTAALGTERLLRNQVLGGALWLGWALFTVEEQATHLGHMSFEMRESMKFKHAQIRENWARAKHVLRVKGRGANTALKRERDQLSARMDDVNTVLAATTALRHMPVVDPMYDLMCLCELLNRALQNPVLRLHPLVYQYSVTEGVQGDPREVYPDFCRVRGVLKKGLALMSSTLPASCEQAERQLAGVLEWHSELLRLPDEITAHVRAQLRPGGVLAGRLAETRVCSDDTERNLRDMDLSRPETMALLERVFREVREQTGGEPTPPRPDRLLPHTGQSLVDAYWSRLGAMQFVIDLMCSIPASERVNVGMQKFKGGDLDLLYDAVVELQLAQFRWQYPVTETEEELPGLPAGPELMTACLDQADTLMRIAHSGLALLYSVLQDKVSRKDPVLWLSVHYSHDPCEEQEDVVNTRADHNCLRHVCDRVNRLTLRGVNRLSRLSARSGASLENIVNSLHKLPRFLVAVQDFKNEHSEDGWKVMEEKFHDTGKVTHVNDPQVTGPLQQLVSSLCRGAGPSRRPPPRHLGNREVSTRDFMLTASDELTDVIIERAKAKQEPIPEQACQKLLAIAADLLSLRVGPPREPPPPVHPQLRRPRPAWSEFLSGRTVFPWRRDLSQPEQADAALFSPGRRPPDAMAKDFCTQRAGLEERHRGCCPHLASDWMLCTVLRAIRNTSFCAEAEAVTRAPGWLSVHLSMLHVLRDCWLPYVLAADRVFREKTTGPSAPAHEPLARHAVAIAGCRLWLENTLVSLYKPRPEFGPGLRLSLDRSWICVGAEPRPDSTLRRYLTWDQACDLHIAIQRRLVETLWSLRTRLPPVTEAGCEVHPAPLELLERLETVSLLLLTPFLAFRDGRSARHLVDVAEMEPLVAPGLDFHGWVGLVDALVTAAANEMGWPKPSVLSSELTEQLGSDTEHAFTMYERALRGGSLLEFLCLRPAYAVPLQLAVAANIHRDAASMAALNRGVEKGAGTFISLPPIAELRSRAARDHSLPVEWLVRLEHVRRVLLSGTRPALFDSALLCLSYRVDCTAERLPDTPAFQTGEENMFERILLSPDCPVNAEEFCDHVFELGQHVIKYQTAMKASFYLSQKDHVFPDRRYFLDHPEPVTGSEVEPPAPEDPEAASRRERMQWAAAHVVKRPLNGPRGPGGDSSPTANGAAEVTAGEAQLTAIERLSRELEGLLISTDHLRDIPEEPLRPSVLARAGRRAGRLSDALRQLPAGPLREAAEKLAGTVQRAVAEPQQQPQQQQQQAGRRAKRAARAIAGAEMCVVETCLSTLSSLLSQHDLPAAEDSPESASESESESGSGPEAGTDPGPESAAGLRVCAFCERREWPAGSFQLCSLCVAGGAGEPRLYCGKECQTDDWEMGHWTEHRAERSTPAEAGAVSTWACAMLD